MDIGDAGFTTFLFFKVGVSQLSCLDIGDLIPSFGELAKDRDAGLTTFLFLKAGVSQLRCLDGDSFFGRFLPFKTWKKHGNLLNQRRCVNFLKPSKTSIVGFTSDHCSNLKNK